MPRFKVFWWLHDSVDGRKYGHEIIEAEDEFDAEAIAEDLMEKAASPSETTEESKKFAKFAEAVHCGTCPANWGIRKVVELKD